MGWSHFPGAGLGNYRLRLFLGWGVLSRCLAVYIYPGAVLPLGLLNADPACGKPVSPDAVVVSLHHCDGDPTPDISACPGVVFTKLVGESAVQAFQCGLRLSSQQAVHLDDERV